MKNDIASLMHKILNKNKSAFEKLAEYDETRMAESEDYEEFSDEDLANENMCYVVFKQHADGIAEIIAVSKSEEKASEIAREEKGGSESVKVEMVQLFE